MRTEESNPLTERLSVLFSEIGYPEHTGPNVDIRITGNFLASADRAMGEGDVSRGLRCLIEAGKAAERARRGMLSD